MPTRLLAAGVFLLACSSTEEREAKERECDGIAEDIRTRARALGLESQGLCNAKTAPDLVETCTRLGECNRQLAEMSR